MSSIELKSIKKSYGKTEVLRDINLKINDGQFVVFVGPSGCGKSTLLRLIAGLETLDSGEILMNEERVHDLVPGERQVAFVFQDYALYPHLDVFENMAFGLRVRGLGKKEIERRVQDTARLLQIEALLKRFPQELSGGQRQRVAMGRALVKEARAYLFDEPLSNLDASLRDDMRIEIKRLHRQWGKTSVYVTHDQIEAMTLAEHLVVLNHGQVEQAGPPMEIYQRPKSLFVAQFIGHPRVNVISGLAEKSVKGFSFRESEDRFTLPLPPSKSRNLQDGQKIQLAIRPSDVFIDSSETHFASWRLTSTADVIEPLGKEALIVFAIQGLDLKGEIAGHRAPRVGENVPIVLNLNHAMIFDESGEKNLELALH